ncbi:Lpg0189 family type II secretion system effector [Legionella fallonii]|uniref:Uncharacterized protein n=1 Tax=Legionella fallonii LLAP-10 TaxID=1212491 RepID=A0A098G1N3_9GAMM|nr:Lpg0189 family type II secretion system effector [Legionella fallonii]CEG56377.1 conserved exported protein of unknown function [Legionella fallonii LLAP-10]
MRHKYLLLSALLPLCAFSQSNLSTDTMIFSEQPAGKHSVVHSYSNESVLPNQESTVERSIDFPTQIIRISSSLKDQQVDCDQVNLIIDKILIQNITPDKFTYNIYIVCEYDPETNFAIDFKLHSYFDPINDKAVEYLKSYLSEYNGADFLGTKLNIESAKGLVISLNIIAGFKKNPNTPPFLEYRKDRNNFYFKSNYEMKNKLIADIYQNFFSNDPDVILPFINKWFYTYADTIYKAVLRDANYVELQPERIFLMESGNEIFVSDLKYYFIHNCNKYENKRCLEQGSLTEETSL